MHVLFGNLLGMPNDDVAQAVAAGAFALAAVAILRKDLILFCFDPGQARVIGLSPARLELILLVLTSLTVVAALQAVGIVLVMAMLVTPGCVGLLLADRFGRVVAVAAGSAAMSAVAGSLGSFYIDAATGPAIVLAQAAQFALAFLLAPKRGLLMQRRRRLAAA
jgi:ABC-type Mn2+/Zn2+ transport system permease subunit